MNTSQYGRTSVLALLIGGVVIGLGAYAAWRQLPPAAPRPDTSEPSTEESTSTEVSYSDCGDESVCEDDYEEYCAAGLESADWVAWASERGYRTGSKKFARTDCLDAQGSALSSECRYFQDCHNALNQELTQKCSKYTLTGQVCAGVTPAPGKAPLEDCLAEHLDEIDAACLDAYTRHEANRL